MDKGTCRELELVTSYKSKNMKDLLIDQLIDRFTTLPPIFGKAVLPNWGGRGQTIQRRHKLTTQHTANTKQTSNISIA